MHQAAKDTARRRRRVVVQASEFSGADVEVAEDLVDFSRGVQNYPRVHLRGGVKHFSRHARGRAESWSNARRAYHARSSLMRDANQQVQPRVMSAHTIECVNRLCSADTEHREPKPDRPAAELRRVD